MLLTTSLYRGLLLGPDLLLCVSPLQNNERWTEPTIVLKKENKKVNAALVMASFESKILCNFPNLLISVV